MTISRTRDMLKNQIEVVESKREAEMKFKNIITKSAVCLFTILYIGTNATMLASATEVTTEETTENTTEDTTNVENISETITEEETSTNVTGSSVAIIEVQSFSVEGGMLEAGKDVKINLTLHNTAASSTAGSILLTFTSNSGMIYPVFGSDNQVYVGSIGAGKTETVSIPVTVSSSFSGDSVDLVCQLDYETNGSRLSNVATIVVPKSAGNTLGVKSIDVSSHAIVNGKSLLSISYSNLSNVNITDAKLMIEGNVSESSKVIALTDAYAGKSYSEDYYLTFTEAGNQQISITLVYTDADGETVINDDLGTFGVNVSKEATYEEEESTVSPIVSLVGKIVAAVLALCAVFIVVVFIKKR